MLSTIYQISTKWSISGCCRMRIQSLSHTQK